jgi:hypothetical protein
VQAPGVAEAPTGWTPVQDDPVQGVHHGSVFEGQALAYVGVTAQQPFRVFALGDPVRVVVDVQAG